MLDIGPKKKTAMGVKKRFGGWRYALFMGVLAAGGAWAQEAQGPGGADITQPPAEEPPALYSAAPVDLAASPPPSPMRMASYGLWGTAGAAAIIGTVFAGLADDSFRKYKKTYTLGGDTRVLIPSDKTLQRHKGDMAAAIAEGDQLRQKVAAQKTVSIVAFSAAGAAAIAGVVLFFLSPERRLAQTLQFGIAPVEGGALLCLKGVWP